MIDRLVLTRRIEEIDKHLAKIEPYARHSLDDFLGDPVMQDVVEYNLFQMVNHLIDIVQHIAVDEEYGLPQNAYEAGQLLLEKGILGAEDLEIFRKMVGFRNVVGHAYLRIDKKIVHSIFMEGRKEIKDLIGKIAKKFL
jgi:uncharacterized protein YutE (UPF0331/DUF86 family)